MDVFVSIILHEILLLIFFFEKKIYFTQNMNSQIRDAVHANKSILACFICYTFAE